MNTFCPFVSMPGNLVECSKECKINNAGVCSVSGIAACLKIAKWDSRKELEAMQAERDKIAAENRRLKFLLEKENMKTKTV